MTINYTTLLGLAQPVTGTEANTWGTVVNDEITALVDSAVAGTTTITSDADVTLTTTAGAANQSRQAIILWTASGTVTRNITAPAQSKTYMVINATGSTQSIVLRGVGPTTGITIVAGEKCVAAWNGSDFVKIATTVADGVTTITFGSTGLTPSTATSGAVSVAGTLANTNGGTGPVKRIYPVRHYLCQHDYCIGYDSGRHINHGLAWQCLRRSDIWRCVTDC
jgi:hypothetical protein